MAESIIAQSTSLGRDDRELERVTKGERGLVEKGERKRDKRWRGVTEEEEEEESEREGWERRRRGRRRSRMMMMKRGRGVAEEEDE